MTHEEPVKLLPLPAGVKAGRAPKWDLSDLVHRSCPVCRCDRPVAWVCRPDGLKAVHCAECAMLYLADIPSPSQMAKFYSSYGQFKHYSGRKWPFILRYLLISVNPYLRILQEAGGLRGKSLLEIGCSFGRFLQLARHLGAAVQGVELDEEALKHLGELGIPAHKGIPKEGRFDVVCAFELMEHLADPGTFLDEVSQVLRGDGRLLLVMPNGAEAERIGPSWVGLRVDFEHLNFFSARALSSLLAERRLYVEHVWTYGQPGLRRLGENAWARLAPIAYLSSMVQWLRQVCMQPCFSAGEYHLAVLARKVLVGLDGKVMVARFDEDSSPG